MQKITFDKQYFNIIDTLECGQIFRFTPFKNGYMVYSQDKCAYAYNDGDFTCVECDDKDQEYFKSFFDLDRDYSVIYKSAKTQGSEILSASAEAGKGVRILNQDKQEMLFSFIISQNNNIPRIKGIIERLCKALGEKKEFMGEEYYTFPNAETMARKDADFYSSLGLGYRASYVANLAKSIAEGFDIYGLDKLETGELRKRLIGIYGVGPKVADCVLLFGYRRTECFPVDVWIEKVYRENFNGSLTDRVKITEYFTKRFGEFSGYYQQYLFYYKREKEKSGKSD